MPDPGPDGLLDRFKPVIASPAAPAGGEANPWLQPDAPAWRLGTGCWQAFGLTGMPLDHLLAEARRWADTLRGVRRPWLCWNVDPDWNVVQQRQVAEVGWTPLVGFDPRVGPPPLIPGAILLDFNERLHLPTMWLHFAVEFLFLFVEERLAFWHSDCLIRPEKIHRYAAMFASLPDGEMAAVRPTERWRNLLKPQERRFWEVVGCSTVGASRSQFETGCSWWLYGAHHPSASAEEQARRANWHWECGIGINKWARLHNGVVHAIPEAEIVEGHFSVIGRKDYKRASPRHFKRDLSRELSLNNDLVQACATLGLSHLLTDSTPAA